MRFECFWGSLAGAPCCFLGKRRRKTNENATTSVNTVFGKRPGSYEIDHFVIISLVFKAKTISTQFQIIFAKHAETLIISM